MKTVRISGIDLQVGDIVIPQGIEHASGGTVIVTFYYFVERIVSIGDLVLYDSDVIKGVRVPADSSLVVLRRE